MSDLSRVGHFLVPGSRPKFLFIYVYQAKYFNYYYVICIPVLAALTHHKGAVFNRTFGPTEQISYMSWVAEGVLNQNQPWQNWKPKFFALRGSDVYIFDAPPVSKVLPYNTLSFL